MNTPEIDREELVQLLVAPNGIVRQLAIHLHGIETKLRFARKDLEDAAAVLRNKMESVLTRLDAGDMLNEYGEVQGLGGRVDSYVIKLTALRRERQRALHTLAYAREWMSGREGAQKPREAPQPPEGNDTRESPQE